MSDKHVVICPYCSYPIEFWWGEYPWSWQLLECPACKAMVSPEPADPGPEKENIQ